MQQLYTCWYRGQLEDEGMNIIALSPQEAADIAVDKWHNEEIMELGPSTITVFVKDELGIVSKVAVTYNKEQHP